MRKMLTTASVVGLLATPFDANATCDYTSANGKWDFYTLDERCTGSITNGAISLNCLDWQGFQSTVKATLTIASSCRIGGNLKQTYANGTVYTISLVQVTLDPGKTVVTGVTKVSGVGDFVPIHGIRR